MNPARETLGRRALLKGAAVAAVAAPTMITPARAQETIVWRVQTLTPKASASYQGMYVPLAKELERRSGGRFKLDPLGAGEIAKGREIFNIVKRGVVPMGSIVPAYNLDESELMGLYSGVPGTLREPWEMELFVKQLGLEEAVSASLEKAGVFVKAAQAQPIELTLRITLQDGRDPSSVKVRASAGYVDYLASAGFVPELIDGPEVYQALATGVVDGTTWGAARAALSLKLWEIAKYQMHPPLVMTQQVFVINRKAFDALPADLQSMLLTLLEESYYFSSNANYLEEKKALRIGVEKYGVRAEEFPDAIKERFAAGSREILKKEMAKGPLAAEYGEKLQTLMRDLGYDS